MLKNYRVDGVAAHKILVTAQGQIPLSLWIGLGRELGLGHVNYVILIDLSDLVVDPMPISNFW